MSARDWANRLIVLGACAEAVAWAKQYPSLSAAWAACERGDWMLWLAGRLVGPPESTSRRRLVIAACACARPVLRHVQRGERRPLRAIRTAERWARREQGATLEMVRAYAYAAASAAYAYAAASAAYAADAADAAYAAYAAAAYAAADAAADAARRRALHRCARILRRYYPRAPRMVKHD